PGTLPVPVAAGAASRLRWLNQPAAGQQVAANTVLPTTPQVEILDSFGNPITSSSANNLVNVAFDTKTNIAAALSGSVTVRAINGVASFPALSIDLVGNYSLQATSGGLTGTLPLSVGNVFTVAPAAGHHLVFTTAPAAS